MDIHYLNCNNEKKLFSFYMADYKEYKDKSGIGYYLEGGFSRIRRSDYGEIVRVPIKNVFKEIRTQFPIFMESVNVGANIQRGLRIQADKREPKILSNLTLTEITEAISSIVAKGMFSNFRSVNEEFTIRGAAYSKEDVVRLECLALELEYRVKNDKICETQQKMTTTI